MPLVVLITAPRGRGAEIARALVERRLAACVNVVPGLRSIYWWQGRIEDDEEELLIVKTCESKLAELERVVKEVHPYSVPEVIALPVLRGLREYIDWMCREVEEGDSRAGSGSSQP